MGGARKPVSAAGPSFRSRLEAPGFSCFALRLGIVPDSPGPGGRVCAEEDGLAALPISPGRAGGRAACSHWPHTSAHI